MRFLFQLCLLALLALASCTPLDYPLNITLTSTGKTGMQLIIQNDGESNLTLITAGSFFDNRPVKKIAMYSGEGTALAFRGMSVDPKPITALVATDFTTVHVGQAFSVTFDAMTMYDLTSAGNFTAEAAGVVWDAASADFIPYKSNSIEIIVSPPKAAAVEMPPFKRSQNPLLAPLSTALDSSIPSSVIDAIPTALARDKIQDCGHNQRAKIKKGLSACRVYAEIGATLAWNDTIDKKFDQFGFYFKSTTETDRLPARDRLNATSKECGAFFHPTVFISCIDKSKTCQDKDPKALGYWGYHDAVVSDEKAIYLCPQAFELQVASESNNTMDLAGYLLSEHTFFKDVYGPAVDNDIQDPKIAFQLPAIRALMNSGTYRMFAQSGYLGRVSRMNGGKGPDKLNSPDSLDTPGGLASPMDWNNQANWTDLDCANATETSTDCWDPPDHWNGELWKSQCPGEVNVTNCLPGPATTTHFDVTHVSSTTQLHIAKDPGAEPSIPTDFLASLSFKASPANRAEATDWITPPPTTGGCVKQFSDSPCEPEPTAMSDN